MIGYYKEHSIIMVVDGLLMINDGGLMGVGPREKWLIWNLI